MDADWARAGVSTLQRLERRLLLATTFLLLLLPASATAGFDEGVAAQERGDYRTAFREFMPLAVAGNAAAQFKLGLMYDLGQGVPQNSAEAARWYRRAADQGHARAQNDLGLMHKLGQGVPRNHVEAARWLRRAADQGLARAQGVLGMMYHSGEGVPQDDMQAYMWLNLAAAGEPDGNLRDKLAEARDIVAARLSAAQRAQPQEMARKWRPTVAARSGGGTPVYGDAKRREPQPSQAVLSDAVWLRVMEVQQSLAGMGYDPGPVDGVIGPRTRAAILAFQADAGLPADGEISDQLIAALSDAGANGRSAAAHSASADPGNEGTGAKPWERYAKQRRLESTGTGFAVGNDGQIVTNQHVVADCAEVRVRPPGQEALAGAVVAQDPRNDLALLRAPVRLPVAAIRDDGGVRAGDSVVAVGFPLPGLLASEANVTTGTVSALAGVGNDTRLLQMTVPVQPGNSGGPLLDLQGRVVGIVVASSTRSRSRASRATSRRTSTSPSRPASPRAFWPPAGSCTNRMRPCLATGAHTSQSRPWN